MSSGDFRDSSNDMAFYYYNSFYAEVVDLDRMRLLDPLQATALTVIKALVNFPILLMIVIRPITTASLGCLAGATLSLIMIPFLIIQWTLLIPLLALSWLWIEVPFLRFSLIIPGTIIAMVAGTYISILPNLGRRYERLLHLGYCGTWPLAYRLFTEDSP